MIAVIADDFTGAAEIGGIGIRYGLNVTIETQVVDRTEADIMIIATDTRSQSPEKAFQLIEQTTKDLLKLNPIFIYKKVDSVLRGKVGAELMVQLKASGKKRALLIPANPALKRTIDAGIYYYDGMPLRDSNFFNAAIDTIPLSSNVLDLIGKAFRQHTKIISPQQPLPAGGLIIGNAINEGNLKQWAKKMDDKTIPAGGSGFFNALLEEYAEEKNKATAPPLLFGKRAVYVCGSTFLPSKMAVRKARQKGGQVSVMPNTIFCSHDSKEIISDWVEEIIGLIKRKGKVILAIDELEPCNVDDLPTKIRNVMAQVLYEVMASEQIDELLIEGGDTAYTIVKKLGLKRFYPVRELAPGVIRMIAEDKKDLFITIKPGSYAWPPSIWSFD